MSDLQIGLLILGLLIIGAVVGFNWWQDRQFRLRSERSFVRPQSDVLLEPRVEPSAGGATAPWMDEPELADDPEDTQSPAMPAGGETRIDPERAAPPSRSVPRPW